MNFNWKGCRARRKIELRKLGTKSTVHFVFLLENASRRVWTLEFICCLEKCGNEISKKYVYRGPLGSLDKTDGRRVRKMALNILVGPTLMKIEVVRYLENGNANLLLQNRSEYMYGPSGGHKALRNVAK